MVARDNDDANSFRRENGQSPSTSYSPRGSCVYPPPLTFPLTGRELQVHGSSDWPVRCPEWRVLMNLIIRFASS